MGYEPVVSASFDKDTYQPGDTITLTIKYRTGYPEGSEPTPVMTSGATVTVFDNWGSSLGSEISMSAPFQVAMPTGSSGLTVQVDHENDGRTWTKVSDDGSTAVYTTTA